MAYLQCTHNHTAQTHYYFFTEKTIVRERHEFEDDGVPVILEWDELNPLYSLSVIVIPEIQVNISGSATRLVMVYNVIYNVTVVVSHLCDQSSETIFSEVYYYPRTNARECIRTVMYYS